MKKSPKPNISPLEIEIDQKTSTAYLFAIASKSYISNLAGLFRERLTTSSIDESLEINQPTNTKTTENGNTKNPLL